MAGKIRSRRVAGIAVVCMVLAATGGLGVMWAAAVPSADEYGMAVTSSPLFEESLQSTIAKIEDSTLLPQFTPAQRDAADQTISGLPNYITEDYSCGGTCGYTCSATCTGTCFGTCTTTCYGTCDSDCSGATYDTTCGTTCEATCDSACETPTYDTTCGSSCATSINVYQIEGPTRYDTAIEASVWAYPNGAETVVIATGENYPDALGGSALAGAVGGPLLLTRTAALPTTVVEEIQRLGATRAYVLGGDGAIGGSVMASLRSLLGYDNVTQLEGPTRYETAQIVAEEVAEVSNNFNGVAFVARGDNYPDALAASPLAAAFSAPILLARPGGQAPDLPEGVVATIIVGGPDVVSEAIESELVAQLGSDSVGRLGGATRYDTAELIARFGVEEGLSWDGVGVATGQNFPDALSGGAMLGAYGTVMLLTPTSELHTTVSEALWENWTVIENLHIIGGEGAIDDSVVSELKAIFAE